MAYKLKPLGMALVAALALTVTLVPAASAASYTASTYPTTGTSVSALGNGGFTTEAGKVECKAHFEGTLKEKSTDLTITPKYTECKAFGFLNATVTGCTYTSTEPTGSGSNYSAKVDVTTTCTIIASTCEVKVEPQTGLSSVQIINYLTDLGLVFNLSGIKYNVTKDGFGCPFAGTGAKTGATYSHGATLTFTAVNPIYATIDVG